MSTLWGKLYRWVDRNPLATFLLFCAAVAGAMLIMVGVALLTQDEPAPKQVCTPGVLMAGSLDQTSAAMWDVTICTDGDITIKQDGGRHFLQNQQPED